MWSRILGACVHAFCISFAQLKAGGGFMSRGVC